MFPYLCSNEILVNDFNLGHKVKYDNMIIWFILFSYNAYTSSTYEIMTLVSNSKVEKSYKKFHKNM